jgi:aminopeptidase C
MVIVGAKLNPDGSLKEILLANSWGKDRGKEGFYSLPWNEAAKKQLGDILVEN